VADELSPESTAPESSAGASSGDTSSGDTTVVAVLDGFEVQGYSVSFNVRDGGRLECAACRTESPVGGFAIEIVRRLEGASDPDAQVLLVAAVCPVCGARGAAVFGYGPEASEVDADALLALDLDGASPTGGQPSSTPR
jgi:hypothetical protein